MGFRFALLCFRLALLFQGLRSFCGSSGGGLLVLFALLLSQGRSVRGSQLTRRLHGNLSQMLRDDFSRSVYRLLSCLGDARLSTRSHRAPTTLQLLQRRREQRIVGSLAVPLDGGRHCVDFCLYLLDFALVRQHSVTL